MYRYRQRMNFRMKSWEAKLFPILLGRKGIWHLEPVILKTISSVPIIDMWDFENWHNYFLNFFFLKNVQTLNGLAEQAYSQQRRPEAAKLLRRTIKQLFDVLLLLPPPRPKATVGICALCVLCPCFKQIQFIACAPWRQLFEKILLWHCLL